MNIPPRQKQIGTMIAQGLTSDEIAKALGISPATVSAHRTTLFARLGVHNAVQLTHYAIAKGWITIDRELGNGDRGSTQIEG